MAITKVSEGTDIIVAGDGNQAVTLPAGSQASDIIILAMAADASCANIIATSGYTALNSSASSDPGQSVAWKRQGATPDTEVDITKHVTILRAVAIQIWRGVSLSSPIDNGITNDTGASGDPDPASHSTLAARCVRVVVGYLDDDDATVSAAPTGYGDLVSANTGQASTTVGATVMMASKLSDTGADDPDAFTTSGDDAWASDHFALRPELGSSRQRANSRSRQR